MKRTIGATLALSALLCGCTAEPPLVARWAGGEDAPALLADLQDAFNDAARGTPAQQVQVTLEGERLAVRVEPSTLSAAQLDAVAARLRAVVSPPPTRVTLTVPPPMAHPRRTGASSGPPPVGIYRTAVDWSAAHGEAGSRPAYGGLHSAAVSLRQVHCKLVLPTVTPLPDLLVRAEPAPADDAAPREAPASSALDGLSPEQQDGLRDARQRLSERSASPLSHLTHDHRLEFADPALNELDGVSFFSDGERRLVLLLGDLEGVSDFGQQPVSRYDADCDALLERKHPELARRIFAARRFSHVQGLARNPKWEPEG